MSLPIKHPLYNLREICKQCVLLEDHLINEEKRCSDCIRKHFLTIEALFEEAASLDVKHEYGPLSKSAKYTRKLSELWLDGVDPLSIAHILRKLRKALSPECFDVRPLSGTKTAGGRMPLAVHVAEEHQLLTSNPHKTFDVFLHNLAGKFAEWAVRQSPYDVPDNLEEAVSKLVFWLHPWTNKQRRVMEVDVLTTTQHDLEALLLKAFKDIPEIAAWNERKNGDPSPLQFVSMHDGPSDPDNDFIDLYALARNVAHGMWVDEVLWDVDTRTPEGMIRDLTEAVARGVHLASGGGVVKTLRKHLSKLNQRVNNGEEIGTPGDRRTLAVLLQAVDQTLTGKEMPGRPPYEDYARKLLALDTVTMHLADGGYSRLTVSVLDPPHLWGHSSNSDLVNRNWQMLKG